MIGHINKHSIATLVAKMSPRTRLSNNGRKDRGNEESAKVPMSQTCRRCAGAEATNNRHGLDRENEGTLLRL